MARQGGPIIRVGTIDCITFYKRGDRGYARMKSSLTAKRWFKDPSFAGSRQCAANMAQASVLASGFYRTIPKQQRRFAQYRRLTGIAQRMLCAGSSIPQLRETLKHKVDYICQRMAAKKSNGRYTHNAPIFRSCLRIQSVSVFSMSQSHTGPALCKVVIHLQQPAADAPRYLIAPLIMDVRSRGRPHATFLPKAPSVPLIRSVLPLSDALYLRSSIAGCHQQSAGHTMPRRVNIINSAAIAA